MTQNNRLEIIKEAERIEEDSLYSARGHFTAASELNAVHYIIGGATSVLAAISGASVISQFGNYILVSGTLGIMVTALIAIMTLVNPNKQANNHLISGNEYNSLKNRARIFYKIEIDLIKSDDELRKGIKELAKERDELNKKNPQIPEWAYEKAKRRIEAGEAVYKADNEEE